MNRTALPVLFAVVIGMSSAYADDAAVMAIPRTGCTQDVQRLCAGVRPGGGRVIACLKEHKDALSEQCKQAAEQVAAGNGANPAPNPLSAGAPSAAPPPTNPAPPSTPVAAGAPSATSTPVKATSKPPAAAEKSRAAADDASGTYLRMKKVQLTGIFSPEPNAQPEPSLELLIPAGWNLTGGLIPIKDLPGGCFADSFPLGIESKSPDGSKTFQKYAEYSWQYSDDAGEMRKLNDPNRRARGGNGKVCPVSKPLNAEQFFRANGMGGLPKGTKLISIDPYPELTEIARRQMGLGAEDTNNRIRIDAIRAHVEYEEDSRPREAWLTAAVVMRIFPVGRGSLYDLHAVDLMALTAPKGQLAGNEKLLRVMISSVTRTPKATAFINKQIAHYYQIQADKEAKIDQINSELQTDIANMYQHMTANAARASEQGFIAADQNLRGVQTFRDPSSGQTMELSNQYGHAWLNGANEYIMSDDPNFNPNAQLSGSWNQLEPVQPSR